MRQLVELTREAHEAIEAADSPASLEEIRIRFLGKKGYIPAYMATLGSLPLEERPGAGQLVNRAKQEIQEAIAERKHQIGAMALLARLETEELDISLPGRRLENGGLHPVTRTIDRIEALFTDLGFSVAGGPEVESPYYNFDALNIPEHHPARACHDTFWLDDQLLLRTQTSNVQIRAMESLSPPIRIIAPGRVYRSDYDQTHTPMFHQVEGLMVDKGVTFAMLKRIMEDFLAKFFDERVAVRFRPSFFPFTEPSAEIDIRREGGEWLEVLGAGMVHPKVFHNVGIDPEIYTGCAFGMGVERLAMLRYGISDLRTFFENDLRFLRQFRQ